MSCKKIEKKQQDCEDKNDLISETDGEFFNFINDHKFCSCQILYCNMIADNTAGSKKVSSFETVYEKSNHSENVTQRWSNFMPTRTARDDWDNLPNRGITFTWK